MSRRIFLRRTLVNVKHDFEAYLTTCDFPFRDSLAWSAVMRFRFFFEHVPPALPTALSDLLLFFSRVLVFFHRPWHCRLFLKYPRALRRVLLQQGSEEVNKPCPNSAACAI